MRFQSILFLFSLPLLYLSSAYSQSDNEFSAEALEFHPEYGERRGHLYMGHDKIRTDFVVNGEQFIQIIDLGKQQATIINLSQKSFIRKGARQTDMIKSAGASAGKSPCANMQNLDCTETGTEMVNGRLTHKWVISSRGQPGSMAFWLDDQRKVPIRQEMPDGSLMEMRMLASENTHGRSTEKWEMINRFPNGESQISHQWYDPELDINVREEQPGGVARNLINIKMGKQPDSVFSIPAGITEQSMPQQPAQ
jgi:hypothetical protein